MRVRVQPGARKTAVSGLYGDALKVQLSAPPVDGRANEALCRFMAEELGVAFSSVVLELGEKSRSKRLFVCDMTDEAVHQRLRQRGHPV